MTTATKPAPTIEELLNFTPIIIEAPQRSEEWFNARLGNVTGSDAEKTLQTFTETAKNAAIRKITGLKSITAKVKEENEEYHQLIETNPFELFELAGMSPPETDTRRDYRRTRVAERLTRQPANPEFRPTYDMLWGQMNEHLAVAKYRMETKNIVDEAFFMLHPDIRAGCSPDGMVTDVTTGELGVLEIKCLRSHNHLYKVLKYGEIPDDYLVQCHMEMWISGRSFCDFVGYDPRLPGKLDVFIIRLERDEEYLKEVLIPNIVRFLEQVDKDERYFRMMSRVGWKEMLQKNED